MSDRCCVIPGCRQLGEHLEDCRSERCKGCRPRYVEKGFVCASDRTGLASTLADIRDLDGQLREEPNPIDHQDWLRVPVPTSDPVWLRPWCWLRPAREAEDVLARVLPMGIVSSSLGAGARVSGSKEPAAPADLDLLDLAGKARIFELSASGWQHLDDQVGHLAVAAELGQLARIWQEDLFADQSLPRPSVPDVVRWLSDRLHDACDLHPAIDEFAGVIRGSRSALRRKLGLNAPPKQLCKGVACRSCDKRALYREGGLVSCGNCGLYYSERDYRDWVGLLNARTIQRLRSGDLEMPDDYEVRRLVA
jgi:hypothetical protein